MRFNQIKHWGILPLQDNLLVKSWVNRRHIAAYDDRKILTTETNGSLSCFQFTATTDWLLSAQTVE